MLKTYKYRIYPNLLQEEQLKQMFGCVRFVYNLGLETKIAAYTSAKINLDCFKLNKQVTELKKEALWLKECPAQALQMSLNNLDNAYTQFFKGKGFPKFKSKYSRQSFQLPQNVLIDFDRSLVRLPKLKWVDIVIDRKFNGLIKTVTVSKTITGKYFVSILIDNQKELPSKAKLLEETSVGIDLGIKDLIILNDGTIFKNERFLIKSQNKLKIEQRKLSRCIKGSNRYLKQKLVISLVHEKIKNQREDYLNKVTTSIVKKYDTIIMENLNVAGMVKNRKLSKAISDVSWGELVIQMKYKCDWYGKNLIFIGRFEPSSKTCSSCGKINKELKLSDREWTCVCGIKHDRDINAAKNIKHFGLRNLIYK